MFLMLYSALIFLALAGVKDASACNMLGLSGGVGYTSPEYSSPSHPSASPHNLNCLYKIDAQSISNVIKVTFNPFNLESQSHCSYDYVAVYEGPTTASRLIGKYCGLKSTFFVTGRGRYMYIHYRTDASIHSSGFRFRFTISASASPSCDQLTVGGGPGTGFIASPGYPTSYPHHADCRYRIDAGRSTRTITLTFTAFHLEDHSHCIYDYIDIRTGSEGNWSPTARKYCGTTAPAPRVITGQRYVYIRFLSDVSVAGNGFQIQYNISGVVCNQLNLGGAPGSNGLIKSPNYPSNYPQNIECDYRILSTSMYNVVTLSFLSFAIEPHTQCRWDYLEVFNNCTATPGSIGKYCGLTTPSPISRQSACLSMRFTTDDSITRAGFNVQYRISGRTYPMLGVLSSPGYPLAYHNNAQNTYVVKPPGALRIRLRFNHFDLEGSEPRCESDSLTIKRGSETGTTLATYCGTKSPFVMVWHAFKLTLMFRSNSNVVRSGFSIRFSRVN